MSDPCVVCRAKCCQYFAFEIDEPDTYEEFEDIRWFLYHENISVHIDEGDWYISIANPCKMLGENNQCKIYDDRPIICRNYDLENCDESGGSYQYDEEFTKPEQITKYAREFLGDEEFEKEQAAARAKAGS